MQPWMFNLHGCNGFTDGCWSPQRRCRACSGKHAPQAMLGEALSMAVARPLGSARCFGSLLGWDTNQSHWADERVGPLLRRDQAQRKLCPLVRWRTALAFGLCPAP